MTWIHVIILLAFVSCAFSAETYYVDFEAGDDQHVGTKPDQAFKRAPGDPKATGKTLAVQLQAGDRVLFKGGVAYKGTLVISANGTKDQPIVYDGNSKGDYGEGMAILDGAEQVLNWTQCQSADECGGNEHFSRIWKAKLPKGIKAWEAGLLQDNRNLGLSQYPTPSDFDYNDAHREFVQTTGDQLKITSATHPILKDLGGADLVGAYIQAFRSTNRVDARKITKWDDKTGTVHFAKLGTEPYKNKGAIAITNSLHSKVLDHPGEYVVTEDDEEPSVYLIPLDGKDPNKSKITVAIEDTALLIKAKSQFIHVVGFNIKHYRQAMTNYVKGHWNNDADRSYGFYVAHNQIERIRQRTYGTACYFIQLQDAVFEHNELINCFKQRGIGLHTVWNCSLRHNRLDRVGRTPLIYYMGTDSEIVGNQISNCTGVHSNGMSIYIDCKRMLVAENVVWNSNVSLTCNDTVGLTVRDNVFHTVGAQPIAFWQNVNGDVLIENNILIGSNKKSGFTIGGLGDKTGKTFKHLKVVIKNNIMDGPLIQVMTGKPWTKGVEVDGNIYLVERDDYTLGKNERIESDLSKLVSGVDSNEYKRIAE